MQSTVRVSATVLEVQAARCEMLNSRVLPFAFSQTKWQSPRCSIHRIPAESTCNAPQHAWPITVYLLAFRAIQITAANCNFQRRQRNLRVLFCSPSFIGQCDDSSFAVGTSSVRANMETLKRNRSESSPRRHTIDRPQKMPSFTNMEQFFKNMQSRNDFWTPLDLSFG